jgi:hypothetical protein
VVKVYINHHISIDKRTPLTVGPELDVEQNSKQKWEIWLISDSTVRAEMPMLTLDSDIDQDDAILAAMGGREFDQRWTSTTSSTTADARHCDHRPHPG